MGADRVPIDGHPGFWRRGKTVCFKYRDHRRRQRWATAPTLKAARKRKAELEVDVSRGEYRPRSRTAFDEYARGWIATYQGRTSKRISEATRGDYKRRLEQEAIPHFRGMLLAEIEPQDIKAFAAQVGSRRRRGKRWEKSLEPVSPNTVRLALAPVKALFSTAFEEGLVRVNPAAGVRILTPRAVHVRVDEEEGEIRALTAEQLQKLLGKIPPRWRLFFAVLAHLGLRIGEAIELRWSDVDLGRGEVRIRRSFYDGHVGAPKTKFGRRRLKLSPELAAALWNLRKESRARDDELVFTASRGGRIIATNLMSRTLKPAAEKAGAPWAGFHTFRHTCATLLFTREGWNPKQVQLWLGHHSASYTLDTYIHLLPDDLPEPPTLTSSIDLVAEVVDDDQEAVVEAAIINA